MLKTFRSVASLLLSYGLLLAANGLFGSLLGVRAKIEGFPTEVIGLVMASYFLGLLIGARYVIGVISAVGHIRAFAAFASFVSITALTHSMLVDPVAWAVMRVASGFCMAGMITVTESWLHERAINQTRGRVLSVYMITNYLAAGSGQLVLPLADPASFELFIVASIIFSLALIPVLLTRSAAPRPANPEKMSIVELFRTSTLGLMGVLSAGIVNSTFHGMGAVFAQKIGLSLRETSFFLASGILGGLVLQWPLGWLSDRIDRRLILAVVAFATCVSCLAVIYVIAHSPVWVLYIASAIYGSFAFTVYSLSAAHTNDRADPERRVQVASGLLIVYGVGAILGPIAAATSMARIGASGLFWQSATVAGLFTLYAVYRMLRPDVVPVANPQPYVPVPGTQFTSDELYAAARDEIAGGSDGIDSTVRDVARETVEVFETPRRVSHDSDD